MGFLKQQEINLAVKILKWQYQKKNIKLPNDHQLEVVAENLVGEAHAIARKRGMNVVAIMKELAGDIKKNR